MKKNLVFALVALLFASLACSANSVLGGSGATKQPSNVLFQDDFSDTSTGWATITDSDGITDYDNGAYRIRVDTIGASGNGMDMWSHPGLNFDGDVRIEVDATKIGGPEVNDMGLLCRYSKTEGNYNFYYFLITSDGYIGIAKMAASNSKLISAEKMTESDAIDKTGTNHIRGDCIGNKLTLYVNGQQVASATDSDYTGGDVGLIAGTFDTKGTDIHFDNFVVTKP